MNENSVKARVLGYERDKEYNSTPLMWAVREKDTEAINFILSRLSQKEIQTELEKQDNWGRTPLHLACSYRPDLGIIKLLLEAGANPNVKNNDDEMVLIKAIQAANPDVVQLLLQHEANVAGKHGQEALEVAESHGLVAIVKLLKRVEAGN